MIIGDIVECIESRDEKVSVGKKYLVVAGEGDPDTVCWGTVEPDAFIIQADNGEHIFCLMPRCCYGVWKRVA